MIKKYIVIGCMNAFYLDLRENEIFNFVLEKAKKKKKN